MAKNSGIIRMETKYSGKASPDLPYNTVFILSIIFLFISIITGNIYFRGVAIGLIISWSTCLIALIFKKIIYKNLIKVVK